MVQFADLITPLTEADFSRLLAERSPVLQRGADSGRFAALPDWEALLGLAQSDSFPAERFRLTARSVTVPPLMYRTAGRIDGAKLAGLLQQGASLVLEPVDPHFPALDALCAGIRSRFPEKIKIGAILTMGERGAFDIHHDPEDLVILQREGRKRWRIYGPAVHDPVRGMPKQEAPAGPPLFDEVLEPGDLLFVPAGFWHHCECPGERSLHLGIFFRPPSAWKAVSDMTQGLVEEELLRRPLSRIPDPAARAAHEAAVKALLAERLERMRFDAPQIPAPEKPRS